MLISSAIKHPKASTLNSRRWSNRRLWQNKVDDGPIKDLFTCLSDKETEHNNELKDSTTKSYSQAECNYYLLNRLSVLYSVYIEIKSKKFTFYSSDPMLEKVG
jgi:hypothetical protein